MFIARSASSSMTGWCFYGRLAALSTLILLATPVVRPQAAPQPALRTIEAQASPARQSFRVAMRDGVKLATDVYLPAGTGPFPAILARTPYNKEGGVGLAPQFTTRGYALVVQDTRGRFASEGANRAFESDGWLDGRSDGYDTVEWIARQPWSIGKVGTWGGSALGITQYLLAGTAPPHLVCQDIVVGAPDLFAVTYRGGAFRKAMIEDWLRATKFDAGQLNTWVSHSTDDSYWQAQELSTHWSHIDVPAVHIGGWYDIFTQSVLDGFEGYQTRGGRHARGNQKVVIGPWTHGVGQRKVGEITFPANATTPPNGFGDQWRWYDHWLKGADNGIDKEPAVAYYVMGDTTDPQAPGNVWRTASSWPVPATPTPYYFDVQHGLSAQKPAPKTSFLEYTYDPKQPVPTVGGHHLTIPAGAMDQHAVEARPDVLVFTSAPLAAPLEVTGRVRARLWVSTDAPDTDFTAKLCDVYPDGRSLNVCDGILRARFRRSMRHPEPMPHQRVTRLDVDLWSTSIVFNRGHCLRVQISSSDAPAYDPNPNTGAPFRADDRTQVAHNRIYLSADGPSHILLPVVAQTPQP